MIKLNSVKLDLALIIFQIQWDTKIVSLISVTDVVDFLLTHSENHKWVNVNNNVTKTHKQMTLIKIGKDVQILQDQKSPFTLIVMIRWTLINKEINVNKICVGCVVLKVNKFLERPCHKVLQIDVKIPVLIDIKLMMLMIYYKIMDSI